VDELPAPANRLPIGALRGVHWDVLPLSLEPGELVLVYSDGVTDARDAAGEPFGDERLKQVLAGVDGEPRVVVDEVMRAVEAFTAGGEPYDDITLVAVRWVGER
jgi:sigma-B regulation protein RsbU (phosphoserine phosphatase)